jgi:hypothetical protein
LQIILGSTRPRSAFLLKVLLVPFAIAFFITSSLAAQDATPEKAQTDTNTTADQQPSPQSEPASSSGRVFSLNWDATIKYSAAFRVTGQNSTLINATATDVGATNTDDGDRAFNKGVVSDRGDIFTEIDLTYGNFGIHSSAAGWGDAAYLGTSADNSPTTFNAYTVNYNQWTEGARNLALGHAELLDAFAFDKFYIGNSTLSLRGGQYALQWGESLFFGNNGIAGGMAPLDIIKLLGVPSSQFKEIIRPVPQVSMQLQVTPDVAIGAYYQLGWQATRLPPVGTFYSTADIVGQGDQRLLAGPPIQLGPTTFTGPLAFWHSNDRDPKNWGQFGAQVKIRLPQDWDVGFYGIQYHEKSPQLYLQPLGATQTNAQFMAGQIGNFYWVYPENVKAIAVSATKTRGSFNYATELGAHFNQDLVSDGGTDASIASFGHVPKPDANSHPLYAVGKTVHGQVSWIASLGPSAISKEATWAGEMAWNMLESIDKNPLSVVDTLNVAHAALDPNTSKQALGIRTTYEPVYRQIFSGVDISIPVGASFFPMGRSSVITNFGPDKGGDFSAGLNAAYMDHWRFGVSLTGYYGTTAAFLHTVPASGYTTYNMKQDMSDRYTVSFNIRRTIGFKCKSGGK